MKGQVAPTEGWQLDGDSAEAYEKYLASAFAPWADALVALADPRQGDRVLDVACGTGVVARRVAAVHPGLAARVAGLDINEDMLATRFLVNMLLDADDAPISIVQKWQTTVQ